MDTAQLNGHKRAVIYARVSTDEQAKSGTSLDTQLEACRKYAAEQRGFKIVGTFKDDYTGTVPIEKRPEGSKAHAMLTNGEADVLIVYSIDRLVRPPEDGDEWDIPILIRGLAKAGREIHTTETGKIETSFVGLLMAVVGGKSAGDERRKIIERSMRGKHGKAQKNKWVGTGLPPFGYAKVGKGKEAYLEVNPHEAATIRRMYDLYLGMNGETPIGMDQMAVLFNTEGIPVTGRMHDEKKRPLEARIWHASAINRIMGNRAYIGEFTWGGEVIALPKLAIIPRETYEAAIAQRVQNKVQCRRNVKHEYLMRGRIVCTCGRKISASHLNNNGKSYPYYQCNRKFFDASPDCDHKKIRAELADRVVWNWLVEVFKNPAKLLAGLNEYAARQKQDAEPMRRRLAELPGLIADCAQQAKGLTKSLAAKDPDDKNNALAIKSLEDSLQQISTASGRYIAERDRLTAELAEVEVGEADIQQVLAWGDEIREAIDTDAISFDAKQRIFDRLKVTAKIEYQNGERGLRLTCILAFANKWESLEFVNSHSRMDVGKQITVSDWVSLADEFFSGALNRAAVVVE